MPISPDYYYLVRSDGPGESRWIASLIRWWTLQKEKRRKKKEKWDGPLLYCCWTVCWSRAVWNGHRNVSSFIHALFLANHFFSKKIIWLMVAKQVFLVLRPSKNICGSSKPITPYPKCRLMISSSSFLLSLITWAIYICQSISQFKLQHFWHPSTNKILPRLSWLNFISPIWIV